jgi:hypothetical protein
MEQATDPWKQNHPAVRSGLHFPRHGRVAFEFPAVLFSNSAAGILSARMVKLLGRNVSVIVSRSSRYLRIRLFGRLACRAARHDILHLSARVVVTFSGSFADSRTGPPVHI